MISEDRERAAVVSIEVDGRQRYVFESDKLREMLGASRLLDRTVTRALVEITGAAEDAVEAVRASRTFDAQAARARLAQGPPYLLSPVSGEIRLWAPLAGEGRDRLLERAWALREWLDAHGIEHSVAYVETELKHLTRDTSDPDRAHADIRPSLASVHRDVGEAIRAVKNAKPGSDARPACSLFAPCRIHGLEPANHWRSGPTSGEDEPRRRQVGFRARAKLAEWDGGPGARRPKEVFYDRYLRRPVWDRAAALLPPGRQVVPTRRITFGDFRIERLVEGGEDQYMAFVCADGDAMGSILAHIDWNDPVWDDGLEPWERGALFGFALDSVVRRSYAETAAELALPDADAAEELVGAGDEARLELPMLPQLLGGEDLWTVCARDVALRFAIRFSRAFSAHCQGDPHLARALAVAEAQRAEHGDPLALTMSLGIAFAKAGHPAHAMVASAEALMANAKRLRKGELRTRPRPGLVPGCIDWHWIESSHSDPVEIARRHESYPDGAGGPTMQLTTRPWTLDECDAVLAAHAPFERIAKRKRAQLREVLSMGRTLGRLAWEAWWNRLAEHEREGFQAANRALPEALRLPPGEGAESWPPLDPWIPVSSEAGGAPRRYMTPLLDLVGMSAVLLGSSPVRRGDDAAT